MFDWLIDPLSRKAVRSGIRYARWRLAASIMVVAVLLSGGVILVSYIFWR